MVNKKYLVLGYAVMIITAITFPWFYEIPCDSLSPTQDANRNNIPDYEECLKDTPQDKINSDIVTSGIFGAVFGIPFIMILYKTYKTKPSINDRRTDL